MTKKFIATYVVLLDNGNEIEYSYEDVTAVVHDATPNWTSLGDRVIAPSPKENTSEQYLLGFVSDDFCPGNDTETYEITLDRGHIVENCTLNMLRKLPFFSSIRQGDHTNVSSTDVLISATSLIFRRGRLPKRPYKKD